MLSAAGEAERGSMYLLCIKKGEFIPAHSSQLSLGLSFATLVF